MDGLWITQKLSKSSWITSYMETNTLYRIARKFAFKNAIEHNGKCNRNIVRNICVGYLKKMGLK